MLLVLDKHRASGKSQGSVAVHMVTHGHSTCSHAQTAQEPLPAGSTAAFMHMLDPSTRAAQQHTVYIFRLTVCPVVTG